MLVARIYEVFPLSVPTSAELEAVALGYRLRRVTVAARMEVTSGTRISMI